MRTVLIAILGSGAWALADGITGQVIEDHSGAVLPSADLKFRRAGVRGLAAELETDREGRFQAQSLAAGAVRQDPNDWHTHYVLGQCFRYAQDYPRACAALSAESAWMPRG